MKFKTILFTLTTTVALCSCSREYYYKYFSRQLRETVFKYDPAAKINTSYNKPNDTVRLNKKKIDEIIAMLEKGYALVPDSMTRKMTGHVEEGGVVVTDTEIRDSFYFRKEKIAYIQKHGLVTPTKHFIPRDRWNEIK